MATKRSVSKTARAVALPVAAKGTKQAKRGPPAAVARLAQSAGVEAVAHADELGMVEAAEAEAPVVGPDANLTNGDTTPAPVEVALGVELVEGLMRKGRVLPVIEELAISSIRLDGGTQSRAALSQETIGEYSEAMTAGAKFPPVVVFFDGKMRWLADGFHRVHASLENGQSRIECEVRQGSQRDAILFSVSANATHGLRRTNADKRRAVELLLGDAKWSKNADRWIAKAAGVSDPFVGKLRPQLQAVSSSTEPRIGQDGKARKLPAPRATAKPLPPAPVAVPVVALDPATGPAEGLALTETEKVLEEEWALNKIEKSLDQIESLWMPGVGCDRYIAALKASEQRAREHFAVKVAVSG